MSTLLETTEPSRRNYRIAALVGLIAGAFSAIVKFGWEVPFPPRTPERNAANPPQTLLEQIGFPKTVSRATVHFNGWDLPISSFIVHFGFAIFSGVLYCLVAEKYPKIKLWQGAAFGFIVWIFFHVLLMPAMRTVPAVGSAVRGALLRGARPRHLVGVPGGSGLHPRVSRAHRGPARGHRDIELERTF